MIYFVLFICIISVYGMGFCDGWDKGMQDFNNKSKSKTTTDPLHSNGKIVVGKDE